MKNREDARPTPILLRPEVRRGKWAYFSVGLAMGAALALASTSALTSYKNSSRLSADVESLRQACRQNKAWEEVSMFWIERPELVLAESGQADCIAYVKAIMSPELERQLNNVRLEMLAKAR